MRRRLMLVVVAVGAFTNLLLAPTTVRGDWASAQSSRGVRSEPNDFWYWHKIGPTANTKISDLDPTDIIYDAAHTYAWHLGDNYLNMPRAWAIVKGEDANNRVIIASSDTEFLIDHWDLSANLFRNPREYGGTTGVDDDGDGVIDNTISIDSAAGMALGSRSATAWRSRPLIRTDDPNATQHGTNMLAIACAVTNNDSWWVGRNYDDYIQELPMRQAGIAGVTWNSILLPSTPAGGSFGFADFIEQKIREGHNIRVMSGSWTGTSPNTGIDPAQMLSRLEALGVLCIVGGGNNGYLVKTDPDYGTMMAVGGVEYGTYRRARINGWSDSPWQASVDYKPTATYGRRLDVMGYIPFGGSWYAWGGANSHYISVTGVSMLFTLGWVNVGSAASYDELPVGQGPSALLGIPGRGGTLYDPEAAVNIVPSLMPSDFRTSGATPQAAGVAALLFTLYPDLMPAQAVGMIRRGCVSVDALNTNTCCSLASMALCHPSSGVRVEDTNCNGLLGAGRLDAYRTLTLWGTVPADTTLTGQVYVSGDVLIPSGVTVTVSAGTHFFVAPDDITQLAPWEPEDQYDMNGATANGMYGSQQSPAGSIQIAIASGGTLLINGTTDSPVVFDSFVNDAQTDDDWIGFTNAGTILTPNGSGSLVVRHSTNGAP